MINSVSIPLLAGAPLIHARFVARPNTFLVEARLESGEIVAAHMADRGRLLQKLIPEAHLVLGHKHGAKRKTQYQVAGVYVDDQLVSLDTQLPNRLIDVALNARALPDFAHYNHIEREIGVGASRFDFGLATQAIAKRIGGLCECLLEVKSVGDVENGIAVFPDAPTSRGRRHLLELADLAEQGKRCAVLFVVQRGDGTAVAVNRVIDPAFADTLAEVAQRGVELSAYSCPLTLDGITLGVALPVLV